MKVFDPIRKKRVAMSPEESVRQNLIKYLTSQKGYPETLISVETSLKCAGMGKRCDILVYDKNGVALMLIECKAPEIPINKKVFEQISVYNLTVKAPFVLITNGLQTFCIEAAIMNKPPRILTEIPEYEEMKKRLNT